VIKKKSNIVEISRERYLDYEKRHQDILDAAIRLFNAEGYTGATTAKIAREARISEPTMYKHFKNKKDLFLACFQSIANQLLLKYREVYKKNLDDEIGYLKGVARAYFDFVAQNPHKSMFIIHMVSYKNDPDLDRAFKEFMESTIEGLRRVIDSAKKKHKVKSNVDTHLLAGMFASQYFPVVRLGEFASQEKFKWEIFFQLISDMLKIE